MGSPGSTIEDEGLDPLSDDGTVIAIAIRAMTQLGTVRFDRSANFPITEIARCFGGLFAELATYPDRELLQSPPSAAIDEQDEVLAGLLRRRWHKKVFEMYSAADRVASELADVRIKYDLSTPLHQVEGEVLRSPGSLTTRALALHRRLEATFETLAGSTKVEEARDFLESLAEVEKNDQQTITSMVNQTTHSW